jgi:Carboxypeptidase regulatory-like domain
MSRSRQSRRAVLCLLPAAFWLLPVEAATQQLPPPPPELIAQQKMPLLMGTVTDPTGQPIARAAVNYRDLTRDLVGGTLTGPSGRYEIRGSIQGSITDRRLYGTGPHRIEVRARGFRSWLSPVVVLVAGETQQLDIVLRPDSAPFARLPVESIRTLAVASATQAFQLSRKGTDDVRVELVGNPVLLPDHRSLHTRTNPTTASRTPPDAIVPAVVRAGGVFRESVLVVFRGEQGATEFSYNGSPGFLPLEEQEWREVSEALDKFYAMAVDVTRGPERFNPYLPEDMRVALGSPALKRRLLLPPESVERDLSNDDLRRYAALMLDMASLNQWMEFEGIDRTADLPKQVSPMSNPRGFIRALAPVLEARRRMLKDLGAFEARHLESTRPFLRRMLGEGLVAREDPQRDRITHLPAGARMYAAPLGGFTAALFPHFILVNGQIRIVAFDLP